jgi:tetratricopeptide (TPR) repeat protein
MTRRAAVRGGIAAAAALGAAIALQVARDRLHSRDAQARTNLLYVQSGEALKRIVLDFDALASDVYWIRAIQHYGGDRLAGASQTRKYELLYPLLDLTTSLDPYFTIAYRFGQIFLSEGYPGGPGRPDEAIQLLKKGISVEPQKWQYYQDIGFVYYWHLRDYKTAADWFKLAHAQPDAPNWLEPLAAAIMTEAGDRASSRFLWSKILESDEPWLKRRAERGLAQLQALDDIEELNALIVRFPPPAGQPYSWEWLVRNRVLRGVPLDPARTPYEIDPATGTVTLSPQSELNPLPAPRKLQ